MLPLRLRAIAPFGAALLAACSGGDGVPEDGMPPAPPGGLEPVFSEIQSEVLSPTCATAGCHTGASAPQGLRLDPEVSYGLLVGVSSSEVPSVLRVDPGNPDDSYLVQKLEGTAAAGERMPLNRPPLPQTTIDVIRQWILEGAIDDRAASSAAVRVTAVSPAPGDELAAAPARIVAMFDRELDASTVHHDTFVVVASGGDGTFGDGNERRVEAAAVTTSPGGRSATFEPRNGFAADTYRVRLAGAGPWFVMDLDANALDGEFGGAFPSGDGRGGGEFEVQFTVTAPASTHD